MEKLNNKKDYENIKDFENFFFTSYYSRQNLQFNQFLKIIKKIN